jgi:hypothetical protein
MDKLHEQLLAFPKWLHDDTCFVAWTKIQTTKWIINIENIKIWDYVITPFWKSEVVNVWPTWYKEVKEFYWCTCTPNHKFFTYNKWFINIDKVSDIDSMSMLSFKNLYQWNILKKLYINDKSMHLFHREDIIFLSLQLINEEFETNHTC